MNTALPRPALTPTGSPMGKGAQEIRYEPGGMRPMDIDLAPGGHDRA